MAPHLKLKPIPALNFLAVKCFLFKIISRMMKLEYRILFFAALFFTPFKGSSQIDDGQLGGWYMYFWNTTLKESNWGFQGDIQYRNWEVIGDLEQLLLRGGLTYQPNQTKAKFTLGYGNITTGTFGDETSTVSESRIYQEALLPQKVGSRFYFTHRFRYEQRFVEDQDFRTRYRYNLFLNVPFNKPTLEKGAIYLALYNELFINGQRDIGDGRSVQFFDRNRFYTALGYMLGPNLRVQLGNMQQSTNTWKKNQLQFSLHQKI